MNKKILITGAFGQIGSELSEALARVYGPQNIILSSNMIHPHPMESPFELCDVTDAHRLAAVVEKHGINTIVHLAAILSAVGEKDPQLLWHVNMDGLMHVLEVAREKNCAVFTPSSIAAFGPETPPDHTPQQTIQRPSTMYGISKVAGELLCDYYYNRYGVDTRGVRFPGLISNKALPGGGTTDYAVHIYYEALKKGHYSCYIAEETKMDMMYMPDALDAILTLMEADPSRLRYRNAYNITAMSLCPRDIAQAIQKEIPTFTVDYAVDPMRQHIAESWPNSLDDTAARADWGFKPKYDLEKMTKEMLSVLRQRL